MFQSLIVALVLSQLDYCNSVLFGVSANLIQHLQSVQNAAVRLFFIIRRSEHVTTVLISMLRVLERIYFKLAVMTYRSIHGTSPSYPQSCFTRVADMTSGQRLRSSTSHRLKLWTFRPFVSLQSAGGVSGLWCHRLERPASPRRICAVTRSFQTTTFLFSRSYKDTIIWLVCNYHHSSLLSGHLLSFSN